MYWSCCGHITGPWSPVQDVDCVLQEGPHTSGSSSTGIAGSGHCTRSFGNLTSCRPLTHSCNIRRKLTGCDDLRGHLGRRPGPGRTASAAEKGELGLPRSLGMGGASLGPGGRPRLLRQLGPRDTRALRPEEEAAWRPCSCLPSCDTFSTEAAVSL